MTDIGHGEGPNRAHSLVARVQGDTAERLADELRQLADSIDRDQLTVGCSGSPSGGAIYSYRIQPEQTHDAYFAAIEEWLAARRPASTKGEE